MKNLHGETKVIMEYTGNYSQPIARYLHESGIFVCVVNAILVHDYGGNTIRRIKTDKKDAIKIASYGLDRWAELVEYSPEEDARQILKTYNRQYNQYIKLKVALRTISSRYFPALIRYLAIALVRRMVMKSGLISALNSGCNASTKWLRLTLLNDTFSVFLSVYCFCTRRLCSTEGVRGNPTTFMLVLWITVN